MPLCTIRLEKNIGPVIELAVSQDFLTRRQMFVDRLEPPNPMTIRLLVDTGAAMTKIEERILHKLALFPISTIREVTASSGTTPIDREVFCVQLFMPGARGSTLAHDLQVTSAVDLSGFGVQGLLGRDILDQCHLFYNGPEEHFSLAFETPPWPEIER